ncbi:hypothetical protein GCM10007856_31520 [Azospirillum oryzae]|nr:hypothetical protein GCM10007856_31520 [Azospirillum oryzae]
MDPLPLRAGGPANLSQKFKPFLIRWSRLDGVRNGQRVQLLSAPVNFKPSPSGEGADTCGLGQGWVGGPPGQAPLDHPPGRRWHPKVPAAKDG